jgi:MYXO-CTERM domain-containing protein
MVSWRITDGQFADDCMIAWDDLKYLDDHDYDDLVVRVSGVTVVPVPAAAWMFGPGLLVLAAFLRRRV